MSRQDISDYVIHFTKGDDYEQAFERLRTILSERRLAGSSAYIRGGHTCVCFSEAPLAALEQGLLNASAYSRYSPFGVLFNKAWIFAQGGRPVIYQTDAEYNDLPASHNWRHVIYDLSRQPPADFTWEREWRVKTNELRFDGTVAAAVVPDGAWSTRLVDSHWDDERFRVRSYAQAMGEELELAVHEDFEWFIFTLRP